MDERQQIPIDLTLRGTLIVLKPSTEKDYPAMQKILSDPKTMEHLKYMTHLDNGGWTMEQIAERF